MMPPSTEPTHLGDGCYVTWDGYQFWLVANDPRSHERVALEPNVFHAFLEYAQAKLGAKITIEYPKE